MLAVVDYGRGNLYGLSRALEQIGASHEITDDPARIAGAERIILPGVGAYADAMAELARRGLVDALTLAGRGGTPMLGICVGCQLMLDGGEEHGETPGLGLFAGKARRLPAANDPDSGCRIPNVGWRSLSAPRDGTVVSGLTPEMMVYFANSYAPADVTQAVVAAALVFNGADVPVALQKGSLVGVQFHPERSGPVGLDILRRFLAISR